MLKKHLSKKASFRAGSVDYIFLALILILVSFGLLMVYEASVVYSDLVFGGKYHFLLLQLGWIIAGLIGMYILSVLDISIIRKYSVYAFGITLLILIFILIPTIFSPSVYGAHRWLVLNPAPLPLLPIIGRIGFQPSELAKLTGIVFLAAYVSSKNIEQKSALSVLMGFTAILFSVFALVVLEPDFTTAFVIAVIMVGMFFVSNAAISYFVIGGPLLVGLAAAYALSSAYRRARIQTLINPESIDSLGAGYHIRQIMIALGSGGFFGLGLGKSRQKYAYLPEVTSDSIFAVVGEELGFLGTTLVVILFALLIWRGLLIARSAQDRFQMLIASGVIIWIAVQVFINLGAMVRLMPLTGIPLPLISYGGSSTIFILLGLGLVLNVSRNAKIK